MGVIPSWIFKEWHSTGSTQHTWSKPNDPVFTRCTVCNVNKMHGGDTTLCQGVDFGAWIKNNHPELVVE